MSIGVVRRDKAIGVGCRGRVRFGAVAGSRSSSGGRTSFAAAGCSSWRSSFGGRIAVAAGSLCTCRGFGSRLVAGSMYKLACTAYYYEYCCCCMP